jgi:hypothetical protein
VQVWEFCVVVVVGGVVVVVFRALDYPMMMRSASTEDANSDWI